MDPTINTFSTVNTPTSKKKNMTPMLIVGGVLIAVVVASFLILKKPTQPEEKKEVVSVANTPTPTDSPKVKKSDVKIQVVNGTGTPGQAGLAVKALEDAGYATDNIKTGNAEEFDNKTTTIQAKAGFEITAKEIKSDLDSTFDEIEIKSSTLDSDSEFDIIVTTGGKIYEAPTPTKKVEATNTPTPSGSITPTDTSTKTPTPTPTP